MVVGFFIKKELLLFLKAVASKLHSSFRLLGLLYTVVWVIGFIILMVITDNYASLE